MDEKTRFSSNERMIQTLLVALFHGPISVRRAAVLIAKHTGEDPRSVRVVIHRHVEKLFQYRMLKRVNAKNIDITPFGAFYLLVHSPSHLLIPAILGSFERRYPELLKKISDLHMDLMSKNVLDKYVGRDEAKYSDEFASIGFYPDESDDFIRVPEPNIESLLTKVKSFVNPRVVKGVDFSDVKTLLASLTFNIRMLSYEERNLIAGFYPLLDVCVDVRDQDCIERIEKRADCILNDKCVDEDEFLGVLSSIRHYVGGAGEDFLKKVFGSFSMLEVFSLFSAVEYAFSQIEWGPHPPILLEGFMDGGFITQAFIVSIVESKVRHGVDWLDWLEAYYNHFSKTIFSHPRDVVWDLYSNENLEDALKKAVKYVRDLKKQYLDKPQAV